MGFFMSPKRLIEVITNTEAINKKIEKKSREWYFSDKGKWAYEQAKTTSQKIEYFFNYLQCVNDEADDLNRRMAYVMAVAQDKTSKPYGNWPGILDAKSNPIVKYLLTHNGDVSVTDMYEQCDEDIERAMLLAKAFPNYRAASIIAAINGKEESDEYKYTTKDAYKNLTSYESDPEIYFLEHTVIFAMCGEHDLTDGIGTFAYSKEFLMEATEND